ncbi:hypothetical protein GCM10020254_09020 [Streptomyces goshikiensis]
MVDYSGSGLFETLFRAATDRQGHAFLNDSRNPGVWINLALLPGAPTCAQETALSATEEDPGNLYITLLGSNGTLYQAQCATASGAPFTRRRCPRRAAPASRPSRARPSNHPPPVCPSARRSRFTPLVTAGRPVRPAVPRSPPPQWRLAKGRGAAWWRSRPRCGWSGTGRCSRWS